MYFACVEKFPFLIKCERSLMEGVYHYKCDSFTTTARSVWGLFISFRPATGWHLRLRSPLCALLLLLPLTYFTLVFSCSLTPAAIRSDSHKPLISEVTCSLLITAFLGLQWSAREGGLGIGAHVTHVPPGGVVSVATGHWLGRVCESHRSTLGALLIGPDRSCSARQGW